MTGLRVLVTGGRDYSDWESFNSALIDEEMARGRDIGTIIHGAAHGADYFGGAWATIHGIEELAFPADWKAHGRAAGPIRNQRMIKEGKLDLVIAFPGGRGTADCVRRAKAAGIEVIEVTGGEGR